PEITPAEPPTVEPVTPAARSRRPLHILGAIAVLGLGGYGMMSLAPARGDALPAPSTVDRVAQAEPAAPRPAEQPVAAPRPSHVVPMSQPASSGFAPALEPRAIVSTNAASVPSSPAAPKAPVDSSLSPAPADIQLDLPALPGADSLVATPRQPGDSA